MTQCACGELVVTENTEICEGCGEPICDRCHSENDGFCNDCIEGNND